MTSANSALLACEDVTSKRFADNIREILLEDFPEAAGEETLEVGAVEIATQSQFDGTPSPWHAGVYCALSSRYEMLREKQVMQSLAHSGDLIDNLIERVYEK